MCSQSQRQFIFRCFRFDDKNSFMKMKQRALRWPKLNVFWVLDFSDNFNYVMYASISIERINKKEYYVFIQTIKWIQKLLQDRWLLTQVLVNSVLAETKFTIKRKQCIDIWPWKKKKKIKNEAEAKMKTICPIQFISFYFPITSILSQSTCMYQVQMTPWTKISNMTRKPAERKSLGRGITGTWFPGFSHFSIWWPVGHLN